MSKPHAFSNLDNLIQQAFFGLISICSIFIANEFRSMAASVKELNEKMAVVVNKVSDQEKVNENFDSRLRSVEFKKWGIK